MVKLRYANLRSYLIPIALLYWHNTLYMLYSCFVLFCVIGCYVLCDAVCRYFAVCCVQSIMGGVIYKVLCIVWCCLHRNLKEVGEEKGKRGRSRWRKKIAFNHVFTSTYFPDVRKQPGGRIKKENLHNETALSFLHFPFTKPVEERQCLKFPIPQKDPQIVKAWIKRTTLSEQ